MKTPSVRALYVCVAVFFCACAGPRTILFPPKEYASTKVVYLVSQSLHAGIVIERDAIPFAIWPHNLFADAKYIEIGWGDRNYYQGTNSGPGAATVAVMWPTSSVLHVAGFDSAVQDFFPASEIIEIKLSNDGFAQLCRYIADSFARDEDGKTQSLGHGKYGNSRFFVSREKYHLFKTCNIWTARALHSAGCPITPFWAITVNNLMAQARKFGTVIQPARSDHQSVKNQLNR